MPKVILKKGREKSLRNHHPWLFSGAIQRVDGSPHPGDTVEVLTSAGELAGRGAYSPASQIRMRLWTYDAQTEVNYVFFKKKIEQALQLRQALFNDEITNAYRLINAESDGLPGLIVDRYANYLVVQFLSAGSQYWAETIVKILAQRFPDFSFYERSDADVRLKEGLQLQKKVLRGTAAPPLLEITENTLRFFVDLKEGHKTGFYLDQRDNRMLLGKLSKGKEVLNCFSYSGGFGVYAIAGGAKKVTQVDMSAAALEIARQNMLLNNLNPDGAEYVNGDVFKVLRAYRKARQRFDIVMLDPPKFVFTAKDLNKASRGYKDINRLAFHLLKPGGYLFTFSCSGLMKRELFQKIVADAALEADTEAQIMYQLNQAADHPVALNFPEGYYLKGLVCRKGEINGQPSVVS